MIDMRRDSGTSAAVVNRRARPLEPPRTAHLGMIGSRVILQLLAAGRELRTIVGSQRRAAEVRAVVGTRDVKASARVSFITADREYDEGRLDDAAGCEFVDDRIRLLE